MIEEFLRDPGFLDVLDPIGPEFCLYWRPDGSLHSYGWNLISPPTEGHYLVPQENGDRKAWHERPEPSGCSCYRMEKIDVIERANPERNPNGVQRLHWVYLVEVIAPPAVEEILFDAGEPIGWIV